ncbi:MAG: threonylcarbamoyl-AMP synthase [Desulfobulbaceae bacterium]|nr:threonylcarbamoyl-AMP synthase [Desulfobulbaceae bacterium]
MGKYNYPGLVGTSIGLAVTHLRQGGIVAFPTETYYGLAVDPECASAVTKLFEVKKRQEHKPLLLLIEKLEWLDSVAQKVPAVYWPLIKKHWPGPLTLIFQAKTTISQKITGNTGTVGVRISPHPVAQELVRRMGKPITATSANISGLAPARTSLEVAEMLGDSVDYIVDGGQTDAGLCSTIVDVKNGKLTLLRRGQIDLSDELVVRDVRKY